MARPIVAPRRDRGRLTHAARAVATLAMLVALPVLAHDSPEHEVVRWTAAIELRGPSAERFYRRAGAYRELGKLERSAADLEAALRMDASFVSARIELARVQRSRGNLDAALAAIEPAIAQTSDTFRLPPLWMIRAEILADRGQLADALADCQRALERSSDQVDWYLTRAEIQRKLGRAEQRVAGLAVGYERTGSIVLKIEWIEALIDAGQAQAAIGPIDEELADCRWKSSWLLRRGRARGALGERAAAAADLHAAIAEIDERLSPDEPDPSLLADRGLAWALLGDRVAGQRDLACARQRRAEPWMIQRLAAALGEAN